MTTITLTTEDFQFLAAFVSSMIAAVVIFLALPRTDSGKETTFARLQEALGAKRWPAKWFVVVAMFWAVLALCLFGGLIATIGMIVHQLFFAEDFTANRFPLIQLAALTATLGAAVALPFTVLRLKLTQEQTETAKAALFNDKITEAAADLHAQRQVSKKVGARKWETLWEDDIVRRNAAIDRLEGLVREQPKEAARVSRLLSVYVRELSKTHPAKTPPDEDIEVLRTWADTLEAPRSDMQNAVQVLGRLATTIGRDILDTLEIDLTGANLQAMDLTSLQFEYTSFKGASLEATNLSLIKLHESDLSCASLHLSSFSGASLELSSLRKSQLIAVDFVGANLRGTDLSGAYLKDTNLHRADLQDACLKNATLFDVNMSVVNLKGADLEQTYFGRTILSGCQFDELTSVIDAHFVGSSFKFLNLLSIPNLKSHLHGIFSDGDTILLPNTPWPQHWPKETLEPQMFHDQWRAWAAELNIQIPVVVYS
ncbi:pentapeptide repeat-containing protein [Shimia sp. R9_3]|uniref:pentapeptide repeat-containing protein n=1 Tax=Shimia sp. R9_3 TaxID=2821113 RepID=UPI001ADC82BA|nr:pentapeptide repeat-containing protein [Shimia sp. R9_3]MBO9400884.1 pentapeptide repeat-containing protein [Shimia sp. R9_3]